MSSKSRLIIGGLIVLSLLTSSSTAQLASKTSKTDGHLIVHEWGTFTSVAASDGSATHWRVFNGVIDLPEFVYTVVENPEGAEIRQGKRCIKCQIEGTVRMETPVLYFYTDRETDVAVRVGFPAGKITEWYPQARAVYPSIDWGRIKVMPGATVDFPVEQSKNHYYAARNTDAAPIRVTGRWGEQNEKFLFYRGVGNLDVPISIQLEGEQVVLKNTGREKIKQVIVFDNRAGKSGYRLCDLSSGKVTLARTSLDGSLDNLYDDLKRMLVAEGLYEKEAEAMIETWRDSWFEEGFRAFYIFSRRATDATLPLNLNPKPAQLVRVMVGRAEVITPELEKSVEKIVASVIDSPSNLPSAAKELAQKFGRFVMPALKRILERPGDREGKRAILQLIPYINV